MSNRKKQFVEQDLSLVEVKSKFEAEFRRFSLKRDVCKEYQEFKELLERTHLLDDVGFSIYYRHPQDGDLLPINNTENFLFALTTAAPLLRLFLQRGEHSEPNEVNSSKKLLPFGGNQQTVVNKRLQISTPQDFRRVSQIIDVDILPETVRRVRLCKHNSDKPLGFYIRDGTSLRVTTEGLERVPGIFVSRLVPGGLAGSTGLLSVNDEVLEVNGIEVSGKSLDQVTEMMVANSQNLIVTVKPVHGSNNGSAASSPTSKMSEHSVRERSAKEQRPPKKSPLAKSGRDARDDDDEDEEEEEEEEEEVEEEEEEEEEEEDEEEYDEDEDEMDSDDEPVVKDGVVHV